MKMIKVEDAVGTILSHDVTQIIPGEFKQKVSFMKMMQQQEFQI